MKLLKKSLIFLLCITMIFSVAACGDKGGDETGGKNIVADTDIVLAENGVSDYKILVPSDASMAVEYSAEEVQKYIELSTGAKLPIVKEPASAGDKVLSIGRTALLEGSGVKVDINELGRDGFKVVRKGNNVYICGGKDSGTAFGVFEFLHDEVGYEAYAEDAIVYDTHAKLMVKDFDKSDKPAIPERFMDGTMHTVDNASSYRYRFVNEYASSGKYTMYGLETYVKGCSAHALHDLLPRAEYSVNHPEWYPDGTQLCLSKQDLFDEFIKKITEALDTDRVGYRISLGQEDDFTRWCGCRACSDEQNRYGGTGYWLRFCNKVVNKVEEWIAENQPGREIKYSAFAYSMGFEPPVNDNHELIDESCRPHEKMAIRVCTGGFCHYHAVDDPNCSINKVMLEKLQDWAKITDNFTVWGYSAEYGHYLPFFDNFSFMQSEIKTYVELLNCQNLFMEYISGSNMTSFDYLRCYLFGKLCWNPDIDMEATINEFFKGYYGEVATEMRDIFDTYRNHVAKVDAANSTPDKCYNAAYYHADTDQKDKWTRTFVDNMIEKVNAVLDKCLALPDAERGQQLYNRILGERVCIMYIKVLKFDDFGYPAYEHAAVIDQFEADCIATDTRSYREGHSVFEFIESQRSKLYA